MSMLSTREREYRHSTDAIEYSFKHSEYMLAIPRDVASLKCRSFFFYASTADACPCIIPFVCLACNSNDVEEYYHYPLQEQALNTDLREEYYYQFQQRKLNDLLRSRFPDISEADASRVTENFMVILQIANTTHRCPECNPGLRFIASHQVTIKIRPRGTSHHIQALPAADNDNDVIIIEDDYGSSDDDVVIDDVAWPLSRPATTASIMELFKSSSNSSSDDQEGECPICMEKMETPPPKNSRLKMPCSHSFHRDCLINWLNNSHLCPLCRYQLPAARNQILN